MKKILLIIISTVAFNTAFLQVSDSVNLTAGYSNQVFYKLSDGTKTSGVSTDWDLQFFTFFQTASIRINSGFGVEVYLPTNSDTANFSTTTIDTSGSTRLRGDNLDWENDVFTSLQTGHPNYGWGAYQGLGNLVGLKVYAIKLTSGVFKKGSDKDVYLHSACFLINLGLTVLLPFITLLELVVKGLLWSVLEGLIDLTCRFSNQVFIFTDCSS